MTRRPFTLLLLALSAVHITAFAAAQPAPAAKSGLEIRFYPERGVYAAELEARRRLSSVLIHNVAIANAGPGELTLESLELEVMDGAVALTTSRLRPDELQRAAAKGKQLRDSGLLELLAFQFRPDRLLAGLRLGDSTKLTPSQALLVGHRVLTYGGAADRVRVRAVARRPNGEALTAMAELPILPAPPADLSFPLQGAAFIGAGATLHSHHRWGVFEEFALDIVRLGEGTRTHKGDGSRYADYYVYGADVLAAADGVVVAASDRMHEDPAALRQAGESLDAYNQRLMAEQQARLVEGMQTVLGNSVTLDHGDGRFSHYAHLQPGSVGVKKGDRVQRGQKLARVGGSGNSTEPHLHFQVTDGPDPMASAGLPCAFANIEIPHSDAPRGLQSGDLLDTTHP